MAHDGRLDTTRHDNMETVRPSNEQLDCNKREARKRKHPQPSGRSRTTPRPLADRNRQDDHKDNSSRSGPSLFGSPDGGVAILDGQFNATAGHHISVTINARDQGTSSPAPSRPKHRRRKRTRNDDVLTPQANTALANCEASRTSFETYYIHLSTKRRGSPLWIPGPNQRLSIEYRRSGVRSGDVGIITSQGSFDFLFNIFLPRDHPINSKGVPEGFVRLDPEELDLREHSAFSKGSFLASNSITRNNCNRNPSELCFEASASEGAVLAMPEGSVSEDVGNIARLQKYAKQYAESWYKHIICQRGRTVRNGSVRLVTGYDNASAWGMAAFANSLEQGGPQDLRFVASGSSKAGDLYFWDYSGVAEAKAGPGEREVEALRKMVSDPEVARYQNQSLFIRTLNITFQDDVWQQLKIDCDYEDGDEEENGSSDSGSFSSRDSSFSGAFNPPSTSSGSQPSERQSSNFSAGKSRSRAFPMNARIDTSGAGGTLNLHPSSIMNDYILRCTPSAKMAITSDEDWIYLIKETDNILPPTDEICDRILQSFDIREDEGIVTLAKTLSSVQPTPSQMSFDPSKIAGLSKSPDTLQSRPYEPYAYKRPLKQPSIYTSHPQDFQNLEGNQSGSSLLWSPNGSITIHAGQFNATAGCHISATTSTGDSQSASSPSPPPLIAKHARRKRTSDDVSAWAASVTQHEPVRKSSEIYYINLARRGRGSSLWIPGPNQHQSFAYHQSGVRCGDVGIITSQGSFDFLFNIFLPKEHPINSKGAPEGFVPLDAEQFDLREYSDFDRDSFLASNSIRKNNHNRNSNELSFEVSASEGAGVTMPEGSVSEDVSNTARLRKYAKQNAKSWYKHIICQRGRKVGNGDVRLVTGYDSADAWGMAAFSNPTEGRPQELVSGNSNNGNESFWVYSGTAEIKAGPGEKEIEALRTMASDPEVTRYQNQSLFIRTLNIAFQEHVWQQLKADCDYEEGDEDENGSSDSGSFSSGDSYFNRPFNPSSSNSRSQPNGRQGSNSSAGNYRSREYAMDAHIDTSEAGGALTLHPSSTLNDYILRSAPSVRMAITSDEDWMCLMKENDNTLPPADEICDRIRQSFEIREDEETVILSAKESSVQSCSSRTLINLSSKIHSFPNMMPYPYSKAEDDPYKTLLNVPPLINTSPPDSQIHDSYVEESPFNPYPYWTADSEASISAPLPTSPYPHKIYDNHLQYGTTGVLADYSYPQTSLPISPSTETGNEYVAQPAIPSDPYLRHLHPPRPVPPRNTSERFRRAAVLDQMHAPAIKYAPIRQLPYQRLLADYQRAIHAFKDWNDFLFEYLYPLTFGTQDETGPQSPFSAEIRGHEQLSAPALPRLKCSVPLRQLVEQAGYQDDANRSSCATPPHLSSMSVTPPRFSAVGWSSSPSSSWPSPTTLLCSREKRRGDIQIPIKCQAEGSTLPKYGVYPAEVSMGRQTHDAMIPPPLIVPPFKHGLPMDNSLHSDSAGVQTSLSSATDDRFIANRKRIDSPPSPHYPHEDMRGHSTLREAQCLHLPPYPRSSTREEGIRASLEPHPGTSLESSFL